MDIIDRLAKSKFRSGFKLGVNEILINDLYEKIVDINNLKTFRLLDIFHNAA